MDFPGPPSYRILFSGVAQADRIEGKAQAERVDGGAFAGHGGEVAPDYYSWTAVRIGLGNSSAATYHSLLAYRCIR